MDVNKQVDLIEKALNVSFSEDDRELLISAIKIGQGNLAEGVRIVTYVEKEDMLFRFKQFIASQDKVIRDEALTKVSEQVGKILG